MKKLGLFVAILLVIVLNLSGQTNISNISSRDVLSGQGTQANPYLINNLNDLNILSSNSTYWGPDKYFLQTADIDASDTQNWNDGEGFYPIGNYDNRFTGSYDGQNYIIQNLYIDRPNTSYIGLFGSTESAEISNLGILDEEITGHFHVGGLVGYAIDSTINNSYATGTMTGYSVGGLVGETVVSTINNSYATGVVTGDNNAGGLVGFHSTSSTIGNSYATGAVSGNAYVGSLIGKAYSSTIGNSYATGAVSGYTYIGGLVGYAYSSTISNSYATGVVTGTSYVGGLVGYRPYGSVNNSFWDTQTSGQTSSPGGTGLTTSQMQTLSTYLNAGWDFNEETANGSDDIWTFVEGDYPHLSWEPDLVTDLPMYIENQIEDILRPVNCESITISLNNRFADPDSEIISILATGNTNPDILDLQITNDDLIIDVFSGTYGIAEIEITAYNEHEEEQSMSFIVEIYPIQLQGQPTFLTLLRGSEHSITYFEFIEDYEGNMGNLSLSVANDGSLEYDAVDLDLYLYPDQFTNVWEYLTIGILDELGREITSYQLEIQIINEFNADFWSNKRDILTGESVTFFDMTEGNPNQWTWYLDNDEIPDSHFQNPNFTFTESGSYDIALVVSYINFDDIVVSSDSLMIADYIVAEGTVVNEEDLDGDWEVENSPYNIFEPLVIDQENVLTIEEGTTINFVGDSQLIIDGELVADGVTFGPSEEDASSGEEWEGLSFSASSSNCSLTNSVIRNARVAVEIEDSAPLLSGLTIEGNNSENPAVRVIGSSQALLDNLDIDNYDTGIEILGDASDNVPTLTNIRIRHTTNTTRPDAQRIAVKIHNSNLEIRDLIIEDYSTGLEIRSSNSDITPVLTNIRIRHTTNTTRSLGFTGIDISGLANVHIDSLEVDDFVTGILFENIDRTESISPTLTNIRVRHTTNTSRTDAIALKSVGKVDFNINDLEIENVKNGISLFSTETSTPTLTNIRIRHTSNTTRELGDYGIQFLGQVNAVIDSLEVDDYLTGLYFENQLRTQPTTPTLTNIRVRHTSNTTRPEAIAFKSIGKVNFDLNDFEAENVLSGIELHSDEASNPVLTNIRVRHTTNTSRNNGIGITLSDQANAEITSSEVTGLATAFKIIGNNSANIHRNAIIDNEVSFDLSGSECSSQIHHNHIESSLGQIALAFLFNDINALSILNNNILEFDRIIDGANSSVSLTQNIIWGSPLSEADLVSGDNMNITFEYNDIFMESALAPGQGNINAYPEFEYTDDFNLHLTVNSPCIDAGNPNLGHDPDYSRLDIGMNYYHHILYIESDTRVVGIYEPVFFDIYTEGHDEENADIQWIFNDGQYSYESNPVHVFEEAGNYLVSVSLTTGACFDIDYQEILVVDPWDIAPPQDPQISIVGNQVNLEWYEIYHYIHGPIFENVAYLVYASNNLNGSYYFIDEVYDQTWTQFDLNQDDSCKFYMILAIAYDSFYSHLVQEYINNHRVIARDKQNVYPIRSKQNIDNKKLKN